MTEPNKSSQLDELIQRAKENSDRMAACPRHTFVVTMKSGQPIGVKCVSCGCELSMFAHTVYLQGVRDGSQS